MAFHTDKLAVAYDTMAQKGIDLWIIAGQETATNSEPMLEILGDVEFIGLTAMIFTKKRTATAICTPIDANGYKHHGIFEEVIAFPVSFQDSLTQWLAARDVKTIALDFSNDMVMCDGLSTGIYSILQKAMKTAGYQGEVVSAEPIVHAILGMHA